MFLGHAHAGTARQSGSTARTAHAAQRLCGGTVRREGGPVWGCKCTTCCSRSTGHGARCMPMAVHARLCVHAGAETGTAPPVDAAGRSRGRVKTRRCDTRRGQCAIVMLKRLGARRAAQGHMQHPIERIEERTTRRMLKGNNHHPPAKRIILDPVRPRHRTRPTSPRAPEHLGTSRKTGVSSGLRTRKDTKGRLSTLVPRRRSFVMCLVRVNRLSAVPGQRHCTHPLSSTHPSHPSHASHNITILT